MTGRIVPVVMPKWGLAMKEGKLSAWHVAEGEAIAPGQEIMDVETDKIANAVEAADGGLLRRRVGEEGETYPVRALLGVLADESVPDAEVDDFIRQYVTPAVDEDDEEAGPEYLDVDTPAGRIRYAHRPGEGTPIVLIHGFGGDRDTWLFNIDALAAAGPVYALDLPGHGGSTKEVAAPDPDGLAEATAGFMAALGLSGAHVVGHSLGGAVAALLALRGDGLAARVTLVAPAGYGAELNHDYIKRFIAAESRRDLKGLLGDLFADPKLVTRSMVDDVLRYKRLDGVAAALSRIADAAFPEGRQARLVAADLARAGVPALVIWGRADAILPISHAEAARGARVEIIDNAGHMPQMEASGRVNELIIAHHRG